MTLSEEDLQTIEKLASIFMPIKDIAHILGVSDSELRGEIRMKYTDAARAYNRGKSLSKVEILSQEMKLAKLGSPQAVENASKNLLYMEDDE